MPNRIYNQGTAPWSRASAAEAVNREQQRREQRYINQMAASTMPAPPSVSPPTVPWNHHNSWQYFDDGVQMTPVVNTYHGRPIMDDELLKQLVPGRILPPLPHATVTPQRMIAEVVENATKQADLSYVKRFRAETNVRKRVINPGERNVAEQCISKKLEHAVTDALTDKLPPLNLNYDSWMGRLYAEADVVIMSKQELHQLISGIGQQVLAEAKKNGFIR